MKNNETINFYGKELTKEQYCKVVKRMSGVPKWEVCEKCYKSFSHPSDVIYGFGGPVLCMDCDEIDRE